MTAHASERIRTAEAPVGTGSRAADADLRAKLLTHLRLRPEAVLSDDGDSFSTVLCRDDHGCRVVLKYVHSGSADAYRRLTNETLLARHIGARKPLRLLTLRAHGPGYLVTEHDPGLLLRPDRFDDQVAAAIADALVQFQAIPLDVRRIGLIDRERLATYYLKVMAKNLMHLSPAYLTAGEAARAMAIVTRGLPAIHRRRVVCHGDFLPTNLLYQQHDRWVTFTDLEGFMCENHPLFDVLALCSSSTRALDEWTWQRAFLARYLSGLEASGLGLESRARNFVEAYRAILVFFLVYRLNEHRINLAGGTYFDGVGKRQFLARKAVGLTVRREALLDDEEMESALAIRRRNLRQAMSMPLFREHLTAMGING